MPGYKGHLLGGAAAGGLLLSLLSCLRIVHPTPLCGIEWLLVCLAGSLFPDVDIKSKGQKLFYWILFGLFIYLYIRKKLMMLGLFSIIGILPMLVRHRGLFHKWWFIIGVPFLLAVLTSKYFPHYKNALFFDALFFVAGAFSHLLLDLGIKRTFRW